MAKGTITKVMKYELRYQYGCDDFSQMQNLVWTLQRKTREILNRTIQMAYHWDYMNREHFKETGEWLDIQVETGYKRFDGKIYNDLKSDYTDMAGSNLNATIQEAWKKYTGIRKKISSGEMSLPSYKSDQPLIIHKSAVRISGADNTVTFTLFSDKLKKEHGFKSNVCFSPMIRDNTQRSIWENVCSGKYGIGECKLVYDRPKWFLLLTYSFNPGGTILDPEKILGVDLGEANAIYASTFGEYGFLRIEGGEITGKARSMEARIRSMQKQAAYCGEGRIGHGTKTRVSDVYKAKDRIANFRDTINHRYSKALIEYAVKTGCGVIQMEDLSGIKQDVRNPKLLRHWTYYDLQNKITAKAKEKGIVVKKINPEYTSQRCSKCGNIDKNNRREQARFCCTKCGYSANADFNASQNISIKNIEKIIAKTIGAKDKKT